MDVEGYLRGLATASPRQVEGRVHKVLGPLVEVVGLTAAVGSQLEVETGASRLPLEVTGFRDGHLLATPLGPVTGIVPGAWVRVTAVHPTIVAGDALLGRVIDALGRPLDGGPPVFGPRVPLQASAPDAFSRRGITVPLETRVRAIDGLLPLGKGQRVGLFAGSGVGKTTLLGMLCRRARADVTVVGLIGERGREVGDFVRHTLGPEGLARSVVVAATSDASPVVRARGAHAATAIAEHFRDKGLDVLLVMDSVTRFAMALRESSLAAGEPPVAKGYTPSVFAALPALLERTGTCPGAGSITAIYTVLVDGDDFNEPIADAVRGILDGHIVLSRRLADRGVFPAIDVLRSISRVAQDIAAPAHLKSAGQVRDLLATYQDASDLIQIGAYAAGSDPRVDSAIQAMPRIESFLRQGLMEDVPRADTLAQLARLGGAP